MPIPQRADKTARDNQGTQLLALSTYIKLVRATESVVARVTRPLAAVGLTEGQFGVLEMLQHLGPLSQREIGRKQFRTGGNVTVVVDNLEKRGLVRRERNHDDRRLVIVHLTDAGRTLIEAVFPGHVARIVEALAALSPEQQSTLAELSRTLGLSQRPPVSVTDTEP
jgi:MarR family transcriptional regulator, 2-MHQ and catechol-resistance regulon repressor